MPREGTLVQVSLIHGALVSLLVAALAAAGLPVRGAALGGGVMALSLALIWGMARFVVAGRRGGLLPLLALMKITLYLGLITAALTGALVVDGAGFAAGVSCFLVATIAVATVSGPAARTVG